MKVRVLGGGLYGCHLATALLADGHEVELHEIADRLLAGASGAMPARLHLGFHYPRSRLTRAFCQEHQAAFMARYGELTRGVPVNVYAVAAHDSLVDFGTYCQVLRSEAEFVTIARPQEFGLRGVEGAVLTGERHIVIRKARNHFSRVLEDHVRFGTPRTHIDDARWTVTLDCTFCALEGAAVDRYEPCLTVLLEGPVDRAVTIMDGPFPSLYPWDEEEGLSSLTSARWTPLGRCGSYVEARHLLDTLSSEDIALRTVSMVDQLAEFWPESRDRYRPAGHLLAIRAMPRSAADARLVDVIRVGERGIRVRAGKIDAILHAEQIVRDMLDRWPC